MLEFFNAYRVDAQHITSVILALAIWRWGAAPERWLMALFMATMVVPYHMFKLLDLGTPTFGPFNWIYISIDLFAGAAFIAIALHANRNYPLWIAGFQLVAIGAHAVKGMVDTVSPLAYMIMAIGPSYCQLLLIMGGFIGHLIRTRRFGQYREWRASPPGVGWLSS